MMALATATNAHSPHLSVVCVRVCAWLRPLVFPLTRRPRPLPRKVLYLLYMSKQNKKLLRAKPPRQARRRPRPVHRTGRGTTPAQTAHAAAHTHTNTNNRSARPD